MTDEEQMNIDEKQVNYKLSQCKSESSIAVEMEVYIYFKIINFSFFNNKTSAI